MMASNCKAVALAAGLCTAAWLTVPASARAQQPGKPSALEGIWSLVSVVNEKDGRRTETMGPNPHGLFIFDRSGHYAIQLIRSDLPPIAANDRSKATAEESKAVQDGVLAHFGKWTADDQAGTFMIRPVASSFANWKGKELPRKFEVKGDDLKIINPSSSRDPGATSYLVLKRAN